MSNAQMAQEGRAESTVPKRRHRRWRRRSLIEAAGLGDVVGALVKKAARIWHRLWFVEEGSSGVWQQ
jgi:hypothetical protein